MKKAKVAIASVLKPVTDVRAFHKLAISLRETNKYHINIIGFSKKKPPSIPNIRFTTLFDQQRLHWSRILVPIRFLKAIFDYRPDVLVITTFELLLPGVLAKMILRYKLVYDLQENYSQNVRLNKTMPKWSSLVLGAAIKWIERCCHPLMDHYLMAEQCYQQEFPYIKNRTVLENKYMDSVQQGSPIELDKKRHFHFLISGTITPIYGVEEAVYWLNEIQKKYQGTKHGRTCANWKFQ